ncbi:hypothetical protein K1X45_09035 [Pseudochrobactrum sp. Wa41.01b-1]|uniref:hypothetical protein n=1 Tax=Pseudochrobactrum sp. Wa41.01b-1 TaxID=2864102 RepID=UPI001C68ABFF|nr:hypothetical protein [Pseudochrobactrum sp. Wa41.01b-1]QYM71705.1 hypothetical protein K1X45_09035 [Pseudochrobactrum sp. Wa41.01b-1]
MKFVLIGLLCLALGGCSQTSSQTGTTASVRGKSAVTTAGVQTRKPSTSRDACADAVRAQSNAAMLGGALGMVGGFGGFGGRGGMIAGQVASTAGTMVANSQSAKAQSGVMQECY